MRQKKLTLLWLIAVILAAAHALAFASQSAAIGALNVFNLAITVGLLPLVAGFICARNGRASVIATGAAGASITVATIVGVGLAYLVLTPGWLAFTGFILATSMFTLIPSALIGIIGGWVARKYAPLHI